MLVLSRKVGERVVIDGRVTVVVTRVVGNRVTLGIDAPSDVHVLRGELQGEPRGAAVERLLESLHAGKTATLAGIKSIGGDGWNFSVAKPRHKN